MQKQKYISLIVLLGIFLIYGTTYACSKSVNKTEKSCRNKEISKPKKSDCCGQKSSHKDKSSHSGGKKCDHSSCHCLNLSFSIALPVLSAYQKKNSHFVKKQTFPNIETCISSGYYSIWLPPKIS